jgi:hypothetical protein
MSAGTLTLTNNSAAVSGAGTAFNTELAAGDFIVVTVGGVPYTLPVKSVERATALTLVSVYTGPTQSGSAWSSVPRVALNMVTAALVAQSAEALRGLNYDKQNWQQFFTAEGDVTITLPDTSQTTGPSAKKLSNLVSGKADKTDLDKYAKKGANGDITSLTGLTTPLSLAQGGLGSNTAAGGRATLGLGTAATKDTGIGAGQIPDISNYIHQTNGFSAHAFSLPMPDGAFKISMDTISLPVGITNFTLPYPFANRIIAALICQYSQDAVPTNTISAQVFGSNGIRFVNWSNSAVVAQWVAFGR